MSGDTEQAKILYETVFENLENSEAARTEALEYLCLDSHQKGDTNYLVEMMDRIKEGKRD